jgi:uncharacterized membrane protein
MALSLVDIGWGAFVTAVAASAGYQTTKLIGAAT